MSEPEKNLPAEGPIMLRRTISTPAYSLTIGGSALESGGSALTPGGSALTPGSSALTPGSSFVSASDAVESLLLLGQKPVLAMETEFSHPAILERSATHPGPARQRGAMVNYYQKMRMRNNEASKRCRLKRRIKQDSLDKTLLLLDRNRAILRQRVVRLNKIKDLLTEACREFNSKSDGSCSCVAYCKSIWNIRVDFEEKRDVSNYQLVKESRILRNTNIEEVLGADISEEALRPMRRGPRGIKCNDNLRDVLNTAAGVPISADGVQISGNGLPNSDNGYSNSSTNGGGGSSSSGGGESETPRSAARTPSFQGALDLSSSRRQLPSSGIQISSGIQLPNSSGIQISSSSLKNGGAIQLSTNFKNGGIQLSSTVSKQLAGPSKHLPFLAPKPQLQVHPRSSVYNNTIILTPIPTSVTSTILTIPASNGSSTSYSQDSLPPSPPTLSIKDSLPPSPPTLSIKDSLPPSPPTLSIVEKMDPEEIKTEPELIETDGCEVFSQGSDAFACETSDSLYQPGLSLSSGDPEYRTGVSTASTGYQLGVSQDNQADESLDSLDDTDCVAAPVGGCSGQLMDLNALNQTLDLLTMKPRAPGAMTAAEKYVIKSRLGLPYWKAEEGTALICAHHRLDIIHNIDVSSCSLCGRKHRKGSSPMNVITYRLGLEYYMTQGKFLQIGLFVCEHCRQRSLKNLDFNNSGTVQPDREDDRKVSLPTTLTSSTKPSTNLATIQPVQKPTYKPPVASASLNQGSLFSKIEHLNESIQAVNPRYKPLGFSITNLESLSPSVLQDTLAATQAALQTVLSTIAPGQEHQLWQAVKPCLDATLLDHKPTNLHF